MKTQVPKCKGCYKQAVVADAGLIRSIPYWYCRTCKVEVDEYGREVFVRQPAALSELDDYLSGALGRFENESPSEEYVTYYDPFLKRGRKVTKFEYDHRGRAPSPKVQEPEEDVEDDEILGFWDPNALP